jgi:cystathionine beta-lyase
MHLQIGNVFGNTALESAYKNGDSWLEQMLSYVEDNVEFVMDFLEEKIPKIKAIKPEGTYLIWLDCRELGMTNSELKEFMIKKAKVGLNDGPTFGEGGEGFQRMNLACPKSIVADAMHRIENAVNKL